MRRVLSGWSDSENFCNRFTHCLQEATGVILMFETDDKVIGKSHDDHVSRGFPPSPAVGPEIEDVMKIDVRDQWRDNYEP